MPSTDTLPWQQGIVPVGIPVTVIDEPDGHEAIQLTGSNPADWVPRPDSEVSASWLSQFTLIPVPQGTVRIQARMETAAFGGVRGDQHADGPVPQWPLAEPLLILGAVLGPEAADPEDAAETRDDLIRRLHLAGVGALPAWTVDRGHRWSEPSVVAFPRDGIDASPSAWRDRALDVARRIGVATVVEVADARWAASFLGDLPSTADTPVVGAPASITLDVDRRCPMQAAPARGEYCRMHGGPWTSASISAAAGWQDYRARLVEALGCDTCEGRRLLFQGKILTTGNAKEDEEDGYFQMPTRWLGEGEPSPRITDPA